jgi:hypothetical protein
MGFFDFLKVSEYKKEIEELLKQKKEYEEILTDEHKEAINIKRLLASLKEDKIALDNQISVLKESLNTLTIEKDKLCQQIIVFNDEILYQSFNIYTPLYNFATANEYKAKLDYIRDCQKKMIKNETAAICTTTWTVGNSAAKGKKMVKDNIKQILRTFNTECESIIEKVKFNNWESIGNRITKSYEQLNKLNESLNISIDKKYLELKHQELNLAYEYEQKKQQEKEEAKILREQQREEAKLAKEIEDKRKEIEKEQRHYANLLQKVQKQIENETDQVKIVALNEKANEINDNLGELQKSLAEVDYREANQRAGYVYIISNIGSFGEHIYKIGMTRRLEPMERVDELGDASVPFKFDVHAMIFSNDAPKLEAALHNAFANNKLNATNNRKEFFEVTIQEIEKVVKENHDKTIEFIYSPPAQEYRESLMIKSQT